jgi:hypothetical protein
MNAYKAILFLAAFLVQDVSAQNGGTSCATATPFAISGAQYNADTTTAPNWMGSFGPLVSPSNDVVYTFVAPENTSAFSITADKANYAFAIYLIPSCTTGAEPTPIGATATIGSPIDNSDITTPLIGGNRYYVAVTGTAAGGAGANGTVIINEQLPISLQSFNVE